MRGKRIQAAGAFHSASHFHKVSRRACSPYDQMQLPTGCGPQPHVLHLVLLFLENRSGREREREEEEESRETEELAVLSGAANPLWQVQPFFFWYVCLGRHLLPSVAELQVRR